MDAAIPFLLVLSCVLGPIWIVMHYSAKKRAAAGLAAEEKAELERLVESEAAMRERIRTLESILDAETPNWRISAE